ncbi:hypothetical protein [Devosia submarina]|uniref:hypothetical protein n=1 Tax=Devosia submarina TaxID=1173082 RepID=UPI0013007E5E|nr:hypothetical protein [Devosia submarina]
MDVYSMNDDQWQLVNSALLTGAGACTVHAPEVRDQLIKASIVLDDIADAAGKSPFTVIVAHPEYADQADNSFNGTFQAHVMAADAGDAIDDAVIQAAESARRSIGEDAAFSDWAVIACFAGHLDSLHGAP